MQKPRRLVRGISAVIGTVILIVIMVLFIALYIASIERFGALSREVASRLSNLQESSSTIRNIDASWSYNGTYTTIFIDNQAPKAIVVVSIAMVYKDGSYTIISRLNKTINAFISVNNASYNQLQLPLAIPPATQAVIAIKTSREPAALSLAIEASPITAIIIPKKPASINTTTARLEPQGGNGTVIWIGRVQVPVIAIKKGITMQQYPISGNKSKEEVRFNESILFGNVLKAYKINITTTINTNISVSINILMNGTNISSYCSVSQSLPSQKPHPQGLKGNFTIVCYYPINGEPVQLVNITIVLRRSKGGGMFEYKIYNVSAYVFGYVGYSLFDSLIVGLGGSTQIAFYNLSSISLGSLQPVFNTSSYSYFDGSVAIAYDSQSYRLYMVNRSGVFSWDSLGWSSVTSSCRSVGVGAAINIVGDRIVVFPGGYRNYICVLDLSRGSVANVSLDGFKLYEYTSSAVYRDSIVFTALDGSGGVNVLLFNVTTGYVKPLWRIPIYAIAGVAVDGNSSRVYIVSGNSWRCAKPQCNSYQYMKIFVGSLETGFFSYMDVPMQFTVQSVIGYGNRVGMYRDKLLVVDYGTVLLIDQKGLGLTRYANAYHVQ
ncbi:MAG: hypothetical protein QW747_03450 [Ignisphaera sp.]